MIEPSDESAALADPGQSSPRRRCWMTALLALGMAAAWAAMAHGNANAFVIHDNVLEEWGANIGFKTFCGQPWRLLAAPFLHYGWADLAFNLVALWAIGCWVERQAGAWALVASFLASGVLAGLVATRLHADFPHVSSFGAILGLLGVRWGLVLRRRLDARAGQWRRLLAWILLCLVAGLLSQAAGHDDWEGNFAAACCGLAMGLWLHEPLGRRARRAFSGRLAVGVAACCVLLGVLFGDFSRSAWLLDEADAAADPKGQDDVDAAIAYYGQYLKHHPNDADALVGRADVQADAERPVQARRDLDLAIRVAPKDSMPLVHRGQFRLDRGDKAGGRGDLDAALALNPKDPDALDARAMALMDDGDYARAEIDLKRELAADPQNPDALFDLAYCQYRLQQYEKAVQTLRDRMTVKKGMAREWSLLADAYLGMGLCYQGLDAANYALKIGDDDRELARHLAFQRGFLNYRVGDDRQSEADWRQAARLTPDASERAGALENVGLVLTRAGRWQEALANCDAVDRLSPDMAWNALFRAIAADKLGQVPMARLAYARWRASRGPDDQDDLGRLLPDALRGYLTAPPEAWRQATSAAGIDAAPTSSKSNARKPGADARKPVSGARASGARKKANR